MDVVGGFALHDIRNAGRKYNKGEDDGFTRSKVGYTFSSNLNGVLLQN